MTKRPIYVLEFIAFVDSGYVEKAELLWDEHSDDIAKRLRRSEALQIYVSLELFKGRFINSFYDIVTKLGNKASEELIVRRRLGPQFEPGR